MDTTAYCVLRWPLRRHSRLLNVPGITANQADIDERHHFGLRASALRLGMVKIMTSLTCFWPPVLI